MSFASAEHCELAIRRTLDELRSRAGNEPILDSLIDVLVTEAQRRGEAQRAARTLQSVADELLASSRPSIGRRYGPRRPAP